MNTYKKNELILNLLALLKAMNGLRHSRMLKIACKMIQQTDNSQTMKTITRAILNEEDQKASDLIGDYLQKLAPRRFTCALCKEACAPYHQNDTYGKNKKGQTAHVGYCGGNRIEEDFDY